MNLGKQFKDGMLTQNPVLVQVLGMCSTMAITTSFFNGIGMGVAVTIILTLSNIIISAMRKIIPDKIRIAMFIVVIAGFVTCVDLSIQAFLPDLANSLGVFIPLIVVNCIILGRAEGFASKNGVGASAVDGICQGIGYTLVLIVMCVVREFLGSGKFGGGLHIAAKGGFQAGSKSIHLLQIVVLAHLHGLVGVSRFLRHKIVSVAEHQLCATGQLLIPRITGVGRFANVCNYPGKLLYSGDNRATGKVGFQNVGECACFVPRIL